MPDLFQRYHTHLNEYFADWEIPDDLRYVPQGEGKEPLPCLDSADARFYSVWLREQGYITRVDWRVLWDYIVRQEAEET
jgi:hypothetical protein